MGYGLHLQQCLLSSGKKKKKKKPTKKKKLDVATGNIIEAGPTDALTVQGSCDGSEGKTVEAVEVQGIGDMVKCEGTCVPEEEEPVAMEELTASKPLK